MAKKKKEEKEEKSDLQKWLEKINDAYKIKQAWKEAFRVGLCYDYYEGRNRPPGMPEDEWINVNMIYSSLLAELPSLYAQDPYYYVKLRKTFTINPMDIALFEKKGEVRQAMINYLVSELKLKDKARMSVLDAFFQFGVLKVHYEAKFIENPDGGEPIIGENGDKLLDEAGEPLLQPEKLISEEKYYITRIHPDDIVVDCNADPVEFTWIAQRIKAPIHEMKEDERFDKKARKLLKPTEISEPSYKDKLSRQKGNVSQKDEKDLDTCVYYEIYDRHELEWFVIAEGCDEFLIKPSPLPPGIEENPFITLRFVMRDASWYPIPPISQLLDAQTDYCALRSKIKTHRKRFNRKYEFYAPGFDNPEQALVDLTAGEDGTVVSKNSPQTCVIPIADAQLDQGHYMEMNYLRQDFMDLATGANQRGSTAGVDSATEASVIEKHVVVREGDRQGLVRDFLATTGRKLDQLVAANITQDMAVKVSGVQGEFWQLVREDDYADIAGEFDYSIDAGTATPHLPEIERAQWMAFLGLLANAPMLALSPALLKKMAELHHISPEDPLVKELNGIAKSMAQGQLAAMQGKAGSQPGVSNQNPATAVGGPAGVSNLRGGIGAGKGM